MADILSPGEFKRYFEKSERYATVAVELKKLDDAHNGIKKAKDANEILKVDRAVKEALTRTRDALLNWDKVQTPQVKQLAGSKKVFKSLDDAIKINARNLQKSAQDAGKSAEKKVKAAAELRGKESDLALATRMAKELDDFLERHKKLEIKIKDGTISPGDLVKLKNDGKPLLSKKEALIKKLDDLDKSYDKLSEDNKTMNSQDYAKLRDAKAKVESIRKKLPEYEKLEKILGAVKEAHKELDKDKDGWMALVKGAGTGIGELNKKRDDLARAIDNGQVKYKDLEAKFPDPKGAKNRAELIRKLVPLRELERSFKGAKNDIEQKRNALQEAEKTLSSRCEKVTKGDFWNDQSSNDPVIKKTGDDLIKRFNEARQKIEALYKRTDNYLKFLDKSEALVAKRVPEYADLEAQAKLGK